MVRVPETAIHENSVATGRTSKIGLWAFLADRGSEDGSGSRADAIVRPVRLPDGVFPRMQAILRLRCSGVCTSVIG